MKQIIAGCLCCCIGLSAMAQETGYIAIKTGLNIREQPGTAAKVIGKIPYGEKITLTPADSIISIVTEGMAGVWQKTSYKGKTGYVINTYLLPVPPPKAGINRLSDYLAQLSAPYGKPLLIKKGRMDNIEANGTELKKQLYTNGAEWHDFTAYEYNANTYFLPGFSIQQGYILLRLLGQFGEVIAPSDSFPAANGKKKLRYDECTITVEQESWGEPLKLCKKLSYQWQEGAINTLELFLMDGQLVISDSSGV